MFPSWMLLGLEANRVIGLRVMKLMLGGRKARREARLMITEKIDAALKANVRAMAGASQEEIIRMYRRRVAANAKRLAQHGASVRSKRRRRRK